MRRLLIFALFVMHAASGQAAGFAPLTCWIADSLQKPTPGKSAHGQLPKLSDVYPVRSEFEPFRIVPADKGDVSGVDIQRSDLRSPRGEVISIANITFYAGQFTEVTSSSLAGGAAGRWPDAIIPRADRYANERRRSGIGSDTEIPVESIRLMIRKRMENYQHVALLAKLDGQTGADECADRIVHYPWLWESRPTALLNVRRNPGETLKRLATGHASGDHDTQ